MDIEVGAVYREKLSGKRVRVLCTYSNGNRVVCQYYSDTMERFIRVELRVGDLEQWPEPSTRTDHA